MASAGLLAGRLALVTGGGSGIGRAICEAFAKEGAKIAAVDLNESSVLETIKGLEGTHHAFETDISSSASVRNLMDSINEKFSQVPCIVVNSAGITKDNLMLKMDEKSFDDVIRVNLKGTFLVSQATCMAMAKNEIKNGSIINIASIVGKVGNIGQANYTASKAGVQGLTKTMAQEFARFGIRCNAVLPGFIATPMTEVVPEKVIEKLIPFIPLRRMGQPAEIAETVLFLASQKSSYITGSSIEVTGGLHM